MTVVRPPQFDRRWQRKRRWAARWRQWRPWLIIVGLVALTLILSGKPTALRDPVEVDRAFTLCGEGSSAACVIDGDTVAIGQRRIRLTGFDTPELDGACPAEAAKAREARTALRDWLNEGAFLLGGGKDAPRDRYGRELRDAWRRIEGDEEWLAERMIGQGLAADDSWSGSAVDWCA
ncbi:thermonuclease family protein [Erythrobacter litoralis]|uniref:Nuclease n=1 Tax=Erythrobacter litoralis (strain HTCC2594) TaxID=314225 RepID=Q2N7D7_ERYLH|nr:nuclease [Erythrobacter litoralis]ABC64404.1 nuclease [Erythrobacter litoralis HTCC2594]